VTDNLRAIARNIEARAEVAMMITPRVTIVITADMLDEAGMFVTNKSMRNIELGLCERAPWR
jgi:hypothetical protein